MRMALDVHKPKGYRRGWLGEDAAKHLKPDWTITVCAHCCRASCWQGEFYCDRAKTAGTKEITVREGRSLNWENPTWWLKDEGIKQRLSDTSSGVQS
jgi:hypothetical protein